MVTSNDLRYEVYVTPGIPIVTPDKPPGVNETFFQAMASMLIHGARDAVLVDGFMTVKQANALADWVSSKGKNLTTIYITHGHGDHWFGVGTLLERFPEARVMATRDTVQMMHQNSSPQALQYAWEASFPGQIPKNLVIAQELTRGRRSTLKDSSCASSRSATPIRITRRVWSSLDRPRRRRRCCVQRRSSVPCRV